LAEALRDRYGLEHELGRGGMARVYLARDLRHRRQVALKVLHPEIAQTLGSVRFLREIETAASLQHPHIVPLFDSGEVGGVLYYVMPFVEGESLRSRLTREKHLPIEEALDITRQVCSALAYAHAQGIIHRDVKPENILLKGDQAVVTDFGIARAVSESAGGSLTGTGLAIGTPAYMSPEQASAARDLDGRSDVYSMACVLYEMLAGHAPFFGMSAREVMARHAIDPVPSLRSVRLTVPPALERVVMKALAKVPADRFNSVEAFSQALTQVGQGLASGSQQSDIPTANQGSPGWAAKVRVRRRMLALGVGALAIAGAMSVAYWYNRRATSTAPLVRHRQLTFVGNIDRQEISPDGKLLAYVEGDSIRRLVVKDLVGGSEIPIAKVGWTVDLRWSPDGARIMYSGADSTGRMSRVLFPRLGGSPQLLRDPNGFGVFSPNGSQIATWVQNPEPGIAVTTLASGQTRTINGPKSIRWYDQGDWSPDGRSIALLCESKTPGRGMLWTVEVNNGEWHEVLSDTVPLSRPRWSPAGDALYYLRGNDELRKIEVGRNGASRGTPEILYDRLGASGFSTSADGSMLVYTKQLTFSNLWLATSQRGTKHFAERQLTRGTTMKAGVRLSPDGRRIAFVQAEQDQADVFVLPTEGGVPQRVTSSGIAGAPPAWSPDGSHLAFVEGEEGKHRLRTIAVDGRDERTYNRADPSGYVAWAPQTRILYQRSGNRNFHWLDPVTEAEQPLVTNDSVGWMFTPVLSPNLEFVAVQWNRGPAQRIYRISLRDTTQLPLGPPNALPLAWSADGSSLYAVVEDKIWRFPVHGGAGNIVVSNPFKSGDCSLADRAPGLLLVCNAEESLSDAWTIENFDRR
jgi:serine/threonine-protein kinase